MAGSETSKQEFIEMARRASSEIKDLRARIASLEPKAHAYEQMSTVLGLLPRQSGVYGEDLAYTLDKRVAELSKENKTAAADGQEG